jgi:hypothetical protein
VPCLRRYTGSRTQRSPLSLHFGRGSGPVHEDTISVWVRPNVRGDAHEAVASSVKDAWW